MERRYAVGTINQWGLFESDTLGDDPDLTTYDQDRQAIDALETICLVANRGCEKSELKETAAVYDNEERRVIYRLPLAEV